MSDSEVQSENSAGTEFELDLYHDPRVLWFKDRVLAFIGMDDDELFYNMLHDIESRQKFIKYIATPMKSHEMSLERRTMYVSKIIVDKLIHEDKEFTEWSKFSFYII